MADRHSFQADDITIAYGDTPIIEGMSLRIPEGQITCIVGPNACGKSTFLRAAARLLKPRAGVFTLDGRSIHTQSTKQVATVVGLLPQSPSAPEGITVADLVARGRFPHLRFLQPWSAQDRDAVAWAMEATGTAALADRALNDLSGGQRQRVWIAMALAQQTDILLLDEPTTHLDLAHQVEVLDLLTELNRTSGKTIVMVLHDLNQAARYADFLVAVRDGKIVASGPPQEILNIELVRRVFGQVVKILNDDGSPVIVPVSRHSLT
ncbi:MAG: ABC transporter ATP-binding protein [Microlunatus sp.]